MVSKTFLLLPFIAVSTLVAATPIETRGLLSPTSILGVADDIVKLIKNVFDLISDIDERQHAAESNFTQSMVGTLTSKYPNKNVILFHDQDCKYNFTNGVHTHYEFDIGLGMTQGYEAFVFDSGTFDRVGDGGYLNWCFGGNFKHNDAHVDFFPIAQPDNANKPDPNQASQAASQLVFTFGEIVGALNSLAHGKPNGTSTQNSTVPTANATSTFSTKIASATSTVAAASTATSSSSYSNGTTNSTKPGCSALHAPVTYQPPPPPQAPLMPPMAPTPGKSNGVSDGNYFVQCRNKKNGTVSQGLAYYKNLVPGQNVGQKPDDFTWLTQINGADASMASTHKDWASSVGAVQFEDTNTTVHWQIFGNAVADADLPVNKTCGVADNGYERFWMYKDQGAVLYSTPDLECDSLYYAF